MWIIWPGDLVFELSFELDLDFIEATIYDDQVNKIFYFIKNFKQIF